MNSKLSSKLWGLFFVIVGVIITGNILDIWDITLFFRGWWTLFIIVPCCISIIDKGFHTMTTIFLALGILLLLMSQDVIDMATTNKLIIPIVFIIIGFGIIVNSFIHSDIEKIKNGTTNFEIHSENSNNQYSAVFCSRKIYIPQGNFEGASYKSIFGELFVDLSSCYIQQDTVIHCHTTFGDIRLQLPPNYTVKVSGTNFLSSINNGCKHNKDTGSPIIYIVRHSFFGDIKIN